MTLTIVKLFLIAITILSIILNVILTQKFIKGFGSLISIFLAMLLFTTSFGTYVYVDKHPDMFQENINKTYLTGQVVGFKENDGFLIHNRIIKIKITDKDKSKIIRINVNNETFDNLKKDEKIKVKKEYEIKDNKETNVSYGIKEYDGDHYFYDRSAFW